eukprot:gb/GFBE01056320.1/.p1 GENE.gb/GFBE01056320.1/~~gb/GFBE01056320.1/.p1  ORF type:complete len:403 (+),score=50.30 gb/GFBE01056320.1/:1-1209(+)
MFESPAPLSEIFDFPETQLQCASGRSSGNMEQAGTRPPSEMESFIINKEELDKLHQDVKEKRRERVEEDCRLIEAEGITTLKELRLYLPTRKKWIDFCRRVGVSEYTIMSRASTFGPELDTNFISMDGKQRLAVLLTHYLGAGFNEAKPELWRDLCPVGWLVHDTYKASAQRISETGYLKAQLANDDWYDGGLFSSQAPKVVFFQASTDGLDGSIYPRLMGDTKHPEPKRRLLLKPARLALHSDSSWVMFLVSIKPPRNDDGSKTLQLHLLFIPCTHNCLDYCEQNFLRVNPKMFQPFRYDPRRQGWMMFQRNSPNAFVGRGAVVNVAVAQDIPWTHNHSELDWAAHAADSNHGRLDMMLIAPCSSPGDNFSLYCKNRICNPLSCTFFHDNNPNHLHVGDRT